MPKRLVLGSDLSIKRSTQVDGLKQSSCSILARCSTLKLEAKLYRGMKIVRSHCVDRRSSTGPVALVSAGQQTTHESTAFSRCHLTARPFGGPNCDGLFAQNCHPAGTIALNLKMLSKCFVCNVLQQTRTRLHKAANHYSLIVIRT